MDKEFEIRGTLEGVSGRLFVVCVNIDSEKRFLWCRRDLLFVHGLRCKESLDSLLGSSVEINVIVRSDKAGNHCVLAAWIGERPEIIDIDEKVVKAVHGEQGTLGLSKKDGSLVVFFLEGIGIATVRKGIIFQDGHRKTEGRGLIDQKVSFDAVPLSHETLSGAMYAATCVWLGEKAPPFADRFSLDCSKESASDSDDIECLEDPPIEVNDSANDDVLIVEVKESPLKRFQARKREDNVCAVAEAPEMNADPKQLTETVISAPARDSDAFKTGGDDVNSQVPVVEKPVPVPMETSNVEEPPSVKVENDRRVAVEPVNTGTSDVTRVLPVPAERVKTERPEVEVIPVRARARAEPLKPVVLRPLEKRRGKYLKEVILNGTGRLIRIGEHFLAEVEFLKCVLVLIPPQTFYSSGSSGSIHRHIGSEICFDAKKVKKLVHKSSRATHVAVLAWQGKKPSPQTVLLKIPRIISSNNTLPFSPNTVYVGFVVEIPLLDCCLVKFGTLPVLVQSKNILVDPWTKDCSPIIIRDYLKCGDLVALTCKIEGNCVVADVCGALPSSNTNCGAIGTFDQKSSSVKVIKTDTNVTPDKAATTLLRFLHCEPKILAEKEAHKGVIVDFPYRNYAIAAIGEIYVLVHINSIVGIQDTKRDHYDCVSQLVDLGSTVLLWVERKMVRACSYYSAVEARLFSECSSSNRAVLKNFHCQIIQPCEPRVCTIRFCSREVKTDIHSCRSGELRWKDIGLRNYRLYSKIRSSPPETIVKLNVTLSEKDEVHSFWLPDYVPVGKKMW